MKIAILQCGEVLKEFQSKTGRKNEMIQDMFTVIDDSFEFESFDCQKCQYPTDLDDYDFYIITGSKAGVYENKAWIQMLIEFVRLLDRKKKKVIGICFGHQIIAMACHGMVEKSAKGWGIGVAENRVVANPDWTNVKKDTLNMLVSHQDQVIHLPADAQVIAESDFCPFFIVQWNDHFLSTQGHPEWNRRYSEALMNQRRDIIPADTIESGLGTLQIEPDNALFTRWIIDFVRQ